MNKKELKKQELNFAKDFEKLSLKFKNYDSPGASEEIRKLKNKYPEVIDFYFNKKAK
jgi:hypothetical protein